MIKLKCCISILWYSSTTFYEKKWNSHKIKEWWRYIHGSFTWLFFYCSWYIVEKAGNTLQLVQCTFVQTRLQRRINYVIHMKTHDGTGHTICIFSPPAKCLSQLNHILFPTYLKICAIEKNIIKTFLKLTFHVQVMKDRSIRPRHFIINKGKPKTATLSWVGLRFFIIVSFF